MQWAFFPGPGTGVVALRVHRIRGDHAAGQAGVGQQRRGRVRVELEGPVGDRDVVSMAEGGNRALEPALADITPRAHDVRPDLHIHSRDNLRDDGMIPPQAAPGNSPYPGC